MHLLYHLLESPYLLHFKDVHALWEVVCLQPARHLVELFERMLLDDELIVAGLVHAHPALLIQVNATSQILLIQAVARAANSRPRAGFTSTIPKDVFAIVNKLDLSMLL